MLGFRKDCYTRELTHLAHPRQRWGSGRAVLHRIPFVGDVRACRSLWFPIHLGIRAGMRREIRCLAPTEAHLDHAAFSLATRWFTSDVPTATEDIMDIILLMFTTNVIKRSY